MDPQTYALIGISVTLVLAMLAGAFALGKLFQRVDTLTAEVRQLSADVRRTNEIVIALANHIATMLTATSCSRCPAAAIRPSGSQHR